MSARTEQDKLLWRLTSAMGRIPVEALTLDEVCRVLPIVEGAAERYAGPKDGDNVITFAACRRRRARRTGSRSQSAGAG